MNTQTSKYELALNRGKTEVLDGKFPVFFFFLVYLVYLFWVMWFACGSVGLGCAFMSRNVPSNEMGRFDEISSKWEDVHGFDDFGELKLNLSRPNQSGVDGFGDFFASHNCANYLIRNGPNGPILANIMHIILSETVLTPNSNFSPNSPTFWAFLYKSSLFTCIILSTSLAKLRQICHFRQIRQLFGALLCKSSLFTRIECVHCHAIKK